ncbi:MAG: acetate/propionate family kinase [Planctomycetia bacterium]|nr:acetate/propionate family kinase [Planctomycetia bacterium]
MKILVANLGSTSFKYSLYDMSNESLLARGKVERIGEAESPCTITIGDRTEKISVPVPNHAVAVKQCLAQLTDPETGCLKSAEEVEGIGFKAVFANGYSGVQWVTKDLLDAMEELNAVMPAHNPPYVRAMRLLNEQLPDIPLVAAFETGFHESIPDHNRYYGVPLEWAEKYSVKRFGFHGASHRYIATRTAEIFGRNLRVISCHLGGSSSVCAIADGKSRGSSMGSSAQTGLFNNNRVGDFDPFMMSHLMKKLDKSLDEMLQIFSTKCGLLGLSGLSADFRDVEEAMQKGNDRARLAIDVFVGDVRRYLGAFLVELGGADLIVFTGGIGEHQALIREKVCANLDELGIILDQEKNLSCGGREMAIEKEGSRVKVWVIPTNEEIIVARQTVAKLNSRKQGS